jgi:hypothetical protein
MNNATASEEYSRTDWFTKLGLQLGAWPKWRVWTHELKIECALHHPKIASELIDDITMIERKLAGKQTYGWKIKRSHLYFLRDIVIAIGNTNRSIIM